MKRFLSMISLVCACTLVHAQTALPPVWQLDTQKEVQVSTRTIAYLPPTDRKSVV